ncbi:unnamed protein product [Pseudo-nitzschia multistriata]|uniref:CCHC-type domain-containing protein n=1 Tax=Pseudo-nitzschia multistriata TaxID=183589 RepID=A0A448ZQZ2_9STRA|nr:unnamed protein product [Pseudo-nitzschia multistriata]
MAPSDPSPAAEIHSSLSLSHCWRVYPPPAERPVRNIKKRRGKCQALSGEGSSGKYNSKGEDKKEPPDNNPEHKLERNSEPQEITKAQPKTEFWRQKQQHYQYTYPYQVGDAVLMMVPRATTDIQTETQLQTVPMPGPTTDAEQPPTKRQKIDTSRDDLTVADISAEKLPRERAAATVGGNITTNGNCGQSTSSNRNSNNYLVSVPGRVVRITSDEKKGRMVHVQLTDPVGTTRVLSPKEQRKILQPNLAETPEQSPTASKPTKRTTIVLVEETLPFRRVVRYQLHSNAIASDRVLEIGCSTGALSQLVWKNHRYGALRNANKNDKEGAGASWIGMDHSQEMIDKCAEALAAHESRAVPGEEPPYSTKLVRVDALAEPQRAVREVGHPPTVVLIDIGGNRECGPVIQTISWVLESFGKVTSTATQGSSRNPSLRMVIVKSRALVRRLLSECCPTGVGGDPSLHANGTHLDSARGLLWNGSEWFSSALERDAKQRVESATVQNRFKHPLRAPMALSPVDGITPICRYHNYHRDGCRWYNSLKDEDGLTPACSIVSADVKSGSCPFDHDHCHACLQKGHIARNCPLLENQSFY